MDPITLESLLAAYKAVLENEHANVEMFVRLVQTNTDLLADFTYFTDGRAEAFRAARVEATKVHLEANPDLVAFANVAREATNGRMGAHEFAAHVLDGQGEALPAPATS